MRRRIVVQESKQTAESLVSDVLQRAAARSIPDGLRSRGQPLELAARVCTEPRFDHDLSRVPVRTAAPMMIQAKLSIGQPGDKYEREADRVADMVISMPDPGVQRQVGPEEEEETVQPKPLVVQITPLLQRQVEPEEEEIQLKAADHTYLQRQEEAQEEEEKEETASIQTKRVGGSMPQLGPGLAARVGSLRGGGQPLPKSVRASFEHRFGTDFSQVRVHTNKQASETAQAVKARAYTMGRDVVFAPGQYVPDTTQGRRLLAHELTHVVQQGKDPRSTALRSIQRAQTGRPTAQAPYFTYRLDRERHTYSTLASYYGIDRWQDIKAATPGRPAASALREGQEIRIPARNLPSGTAQIVGIEPGLVVSTATTGVTFRWANSPSANRIGRASRGTATNVGGVVPNSYQRAWIESSNLQNRADGVIAELRVRGRAAGNVVYGYLPIANVRLMSRSVPRTDVEILARMIFGEQRNQGRNAMVVAAWIVRNRYDAGWGQSYHALLTDTEFHALRTTRTQNMAGLTGPDAQVWATAQQVAQGVIDGTISDPTNGHGFYFGNTSSVKRRMEACRQSMPGYRMGHVNGTNLYWSNGDYTGGTPSNPRCGRPQSRWLLHGRGT